MTKCDLLKKELSMKSDSDLFMMLVSFGYVKNAISIVSRNVILNMLVGLVSQYTFNEDYSESNSAFKIMKQAEKVVFSRQIFPKLV